MKSKREQRSRRQWRVRAKISGSGERPRLSVFRSNRYIYAQLIDDTKKEVLVQFNDLKLKSKKGETKKTKAGEVGKNLGNEILKKGFTEIAFDRGGYKYHGRVKALAEGLRQAGIKF
ncbi:MAG: 50S ribosomal protein L18 [Patescibacteria group bacterium]